MPFFVQNGTFCPVGTERNPLGLEELSVTNEQKNRIASLQKEGKGYRTIASELNLPINSVKSWCYRHPADEIGDGCCLQCGAMVKQTPHRKVKKFCSDQCRALWWAAHPQMRRTKKTYTHVCAGCGRTFESERRERKYCSAECYAGHRGGDAHD